MGALVRVPQQLEGQEERLHLEREEGEVHRKGHHQGLNAIGVPLNAQGSFPFFFFPNVGLYFSQLRILQTSNPCFPNLDLLGGGFSRHPRVYWKLWVYCDMMSKIYFWNKRYLPK